MTRKRSFSDEPSDREGLGEDASNYYDDGDVKDYYYYDGRRKKEQYLYQRRKRQMTLFTVSVTADSDNEQVRVVFTTNANGSATGFSANVSQQGEDSVNFYLSLCREQTI